MAKVYKKLKTDYTIASNEVLRHGLSLKAIGLYLYIIAKPDGWDFSLVGTATQVSDGIDSIRSAAKELEDAGFLVRKRVRFQNGKLGDADWVITDDPLENPIEMPGEALEKPTLEKPTQEKPTTENPMQVSNKEVSINEVNTNSVSKDTEPSSGVETTGNGTITLKGKNGYGNQDITSLIEYTKLKLELPTLDGTIKQNRQYAYNLLRKFNGLEKCKLIVDAASMNDFWRNKITSMQNLYYNGVRLVSETRDPKGKVLYVDE